jgi:hypothetical protein
LYLIWFTSLKKMKIILSSSGKSLQSSKASGDMLKLL